MCGLKKLFFLALSVFILLINVDCKLTSANQRANNHSLNRNDKTIDVLNLLSDLVNHLAGNKYSERSIKEIIHQFETRLPISYFNDSNTSDTKNISIQIAVSDKKENHAVDLVLPDDITNHLKLKQIENKFGIADFIDPNMPKPKMVLPKRINLISYTNRNNDDLFLLVQTTNNLDDATNTVLRIEIIKSNHQ